MTHVTHAIERHSDIKAVANTITLITKRRSDSHGLQFGSKCEQGGVAVLLSYIETFYARVVVKAMTVVNNGKRSLVPKTLSDDLDEIVRESPFRGEWEI